MTSSTLKGWGYVFKFLFAVFGLLLIGNYLLENSLLVGIAWVFGMSFLYKVGYFKKPNLSEKSN